MTHIQPKPNTQELSHRATRLDRRIRSGMLALAAMALPIGLAADREPSQAPAGVPQAVHSEIGVAPADEVDTGSTLLKLPGGALTAIAWSPDGRTLAFIGVKGGVRQAYLRDLDRDSACQLEGTDGARHMVFSPDGEWIAFWASGQIRKVRIAGGPPVKLCDAPGGTGLAWGPSRVVYAAARQLFEVPSDGGAPRTLIDSGRRVASPHLLPGDAALLYTEYQKNWTSGDERVMVLPLTPGGAPSVLLSEAADARYLATGHLAFLRQGTLFVAPFDAKTLTLRGGEVAIVKDVAQAVATWFAPDLTLAGQWAASSRGTLAYVPNPTASFPRSELVSIARDGRVTTLGAPVDHYREHIEPSPNGSRLAVSVQAARSVQLRLYDLAQGTLSPPVIESEHSEAVRPVWSKGGRIAATVIEGGTTHLVVFNPDSPSSPEVVGDSAGFSPSSWSPDGERLVGTRAGDLWVYSRTAKGPAFAPLAKTPAAESFPAWSPDGQWLAYASNASGREEVYVQPYPGPGKAIQVSANGGRSPVWNPQGKELFYAEPPQAAGTEWRLKQATGPEWRMMMVDMTDPLNPGRPTVMFPFQPASLPLASCTPTNCYSVAPDGRQFFAQRMLPRESTPVTHIHVIQNWFEELKAKVPR